MESKEIQINFKEELFKYLLYWKWILISIILAITVCFFYLRYATDVYQTFAKIQIIDENNNSFKMPDNSISIFGNGVKENLENKIEIIKSSRIIGAVIDSLNLNTEVYSAGNIKSIELWEKSPFTIIWSGNNDSLKNKSITYKIQISENGYLLDGSSKEYQFGKTNFDAIFPFKIDLKFPTSLNKRLGYTYLIVLKDRKNSIESIVNNLSIDYVGSQSDILKISLKGNNNNKINDIVNTLISVFNQDGISDRQLVYKKTIEFVDNRFNYLFTELDSIEQYKADYKKNNKITFVEQDAGLIMQNNYQSQSNLQNANTQISLSNIMISAINNGAELELLPSNLGIESIEVNQQIEQYNQQLLSRNKLLASGAGLSNPVVKESTNQAEKLKKSIGNSLSIYQKALNTQKNDLNKINSIDKIKYSQMPSNEKAIRSIERQQSIKENLYVLLLQKREEAAVNLAITNPSIKVVDYANVSNSPISPNRKVYYLFALTIGLLLPLVFIYLYYLSNNKIQNKEDIENEIKDIPVIGEIPYIESDDKTIKYSDRSVLSESFRILRTNINYISPIENKSNVLFVTSSIKGEGKTFISINLAITLSTLGKKVIIIGADLRNPQLHKLVNLDRQYIKGVSNYLYNTSLEINDIIVDNSLNNRSYDVILSGLIPPNPAELLSNGRFELLLNNLKEQYDYVIVDTSPTLLITDTTLILNLADSILYVTRANFTEKKLLHFITNLKKINSLKNIGIILNNVGQNKVYGSNYAYSYNYGYGYGYENDSNKKTSLNSKIKKYFRDLFKR